MGQEYDEETQLNYLQQRYQNSSNGQFISQDPLFLATADRWNLQNPQSFNSYSYAENNPVINKDPFGLFKIKTGQIEKGDTLSAITKQINSAYSTNLTVSKIASANGIKNANLIYAGNFITLPGKNVQLEFDNKTLKAVDKTYGNNGKNISWKATSGSDSRGYDPISAGTWTADPKNTHKSSDVSTSTNVASTLSGITQNIPIVGKKLGPWPGGTYAWGTERTELSNGNGDTGYYIHGGSSEGSAGCIDLTSENNNFHDWLRSYGQPVDVIVNY